MVIYKPYRMAIRKSGLSPYTREQADEIAREYLAATGEEVGAEIGHTLKVNECVILISNSGKILRFIFGIIEHDMVNSAGRAMAERTTKILPSRTYRITQGGVFSPYMLQNYANDLGIELEHLKRLEAHLRLEAEAARDT